MAIGMLPPVYFAKIAGENPTTKDDVMYTDKVFFPDISKTLIITC